MLQELGSNGMLDCVIQVFTGHRDMGGNREDLVSGRFSEAVEVTAVQQGARGGAREIGLTVCDLHRT